MIQRQQTLWLILATVCAFLSFKFPFVTGKEILTNSAGNAMADIVVDAGSNLFLIILTAASMIISLVAIFTFKDRKLQIRLCFAGLLLSVIIIVLYISKYTQIVKPVPALWCILPFVMLLSYFMAWRGVRNDEKLVKSLDKLR
jgi:uncharacterized membrane protein (UPF0182 family)